MSNPVRTVGEHLTVIKQRIEANLACVLPEVSNLEWMRQDGSQLSSDQAKRALKRVASMYLGPRSQLMLHDWVDADKVAAQLILIARQRHADLHGAKKLSDVAAHVYTTYGMAYGFANVPMEFDAVVVSINEKSVGVYLPERVAVLA